MRPTLGVSALKLELLADAQGVAYGLVDALIYNNESYDRVWSNAQEERVSERFPLV